MFGAADPIDHRTWYLQSWQLAIYCSLTLPSSMADYIRVTEYTYILHSERRKLYGTARLKITAVYVRRRYVT
jgi:hypothetical protein